MAGYTRQSLPDIQNGSEITAPPLNAEFDQLSTAFGVSGHTHDGTAGNAPKIDLTTSVSGYLPQVHGGVGGKNNTSATSNPTIADDSTQGYVIGSVWINTTTKRQYVCVSNTAGAASWLETPTIDANNNILPQVDDTVSIGSATYRLKDAYFGGNMDIDGTLNVATTSTLTGDVTMGGDLTLSTGTATIPTVTISAGNIDNTIIGSSTPAAITATDLTTTGSATLPTVTLGQGSGTVGTLNGVIVGGSNPLAVTGTIITANNGFTGDLTGDVTGNVTAASGTSTFTNLTASGTITGDVTGDLTGNVTSAGTSTFNNVTISGTLNMDGATTATIQNLSAPVNPNDAARKTDVDTAIANLVDTAPTTLDTLNELAAALDDDPNFSTTITNSIATKLPLAGGTMTGDIIMDTNSITSMADPVNAQDAATKNYTDTQDALKLNLTGGTMSGAIAMGNNTISGVPNPSANDQVSNKAYVDSILGSATSAAASAAAASTSEGNALSSANDAAASATEAEDWATETATTVDGTEYSAKEYAIGTQTRGTTGSAKDWAVYTGGTVNGTDYSAKYWATQGDVGTVASNITEITNVANNITEIATVGDATNIAAVTTVANNINNVTDFFDTYFVSATAPTTNVTVGDLWFDTTSQIMKVYSSSGWQNAGSSVNGTADRVTYTATASQTTFAATYDTGYIDVFLNGVKLVDGTDFTATNGSNIVLASGASAGDVVDIVAYGTFQIADVYTKTQSDARYAQVANNLSDVDAGLSRSNLGLVIGTDVQAYDADTAKYDDVTANFTGTLQNGGSNVVVDSDIGVNVQAYNANLTSIDQALATTNSPSFVNLNLTGGVVENTTTLSGTAVSLSYTNGTVQSHTLTGATEYTDGLNDGEAIVLMINGGDANTVTWTAVTKWVTSSGNAAPTLTANDTVIVWKIGTTVYAAYAGSYT